MDCSAARKSKQARDTKMAGPDDDDSDLSSTAIGSNEVDSKAGRGDWRGLFAFTTRRHIPLLAYAILTSVANGVVAPVMAIYVGKIFQDFADYGGGISTSSELQEVILSNVFVLVGLSVATWIVGSCTFTFWILFGEKQVSNARLRLFDGLLAKPIAYFEASSTGMGAITPRMQT